MVTQEAMTLACPDSSDAKMPSHAMLRNSLFMPISSAIAAMMSLVNQFYSKGSITKGEMSVLIRLLNPVAPHITEEINALSGCVSGELLHAEWPKCDESKLIKSTVEIAMQINGKIRGRIEIPAGLTVYRVKNLREAIEMAL